MKFLISFFLLFILLSNITTNVIFFRLENQIQKEFQIQKENQIQKEFYYKVVNVFRDTDDGLKYGLYNFEVDDACNNGWEYVGISCPNGSTDAIFLLMRREKDDLKAKEWMEKTIDKEKLNKVAEEEPFDISKIDKKTLQHFSAYRLVEMKRSNLLSMKKQLENKILIINGKIDEITQNNILFKFTDKFYEFLYCNYNKSLESKILKYAKGDNITIIGKLIFSQSDFKVEILDIVD